MTNPQLENGYIRIADEIADALAKFNMSGSENRILWAIFRKTYGWGKKSDKISLSQLEELTGIARHHIPRELQKLISKKVIICDCTTYIKTYSFNKKVDEWEAKLLPKQVAPKLVTPKTVTEMGNTPLPKLVTPSTGSGNTSVTETGNNNKQIDNITINTNTINRETQLSSGKRNSLSSLTETDFDEISQRYEVPVSFVRGKFEDLNDYCAAHGKKYKDYRAALRSWVRKDAMKIREEVKHEKHGLTIASPDPNWVG